MMNPSRSERKSRRSSILKPPKPRQPFENVEINASSTENSPTTITGKIKRRVSFAEKKHVKEFCDSPEQGTVWDNTYEESETSHMKNSSNSNGDENIISNEVVEKSRISIVTESSVCISQSVNKEKTKISVDGYFKTVESDLNLRHTMGGFPSMRPSGIPLPPNHSKSFNARRSLSVTDIVFAKSADKENAPFMENPDSYPAKDSTTSIASSIQNPPNFIPSPMQDDDCNEISMDETLIGDVAVGPTIPTPLTLSRDGPVLRSSFNMVPNIDFVENDPISHLPLGKDSTKLKDAVRDDDKENPKKTIEMTEPNEGQTMFPKVQDAITVYRDTSMEITEAITNRMSILSKRPPNKLGDNVSKEPLLAAEQKTSFQMKAEETVTKILGLSGTGFKESDRIAVDLRPEKMSMLHNKSVQLGKVLQNVSSAQKLKQTTPERTTIFRNEPVDLTEIVQNIRSSEQSEKIAPERMTIFHDKSLDFTEAVENVPSTEKMMLQERTTVFRNKSPDFTQVVRSRQSYGNLQKSSPEKTKLFHNQSVDMTEAVPSNSGMKSSEKPTTEKTMIFHNQPVDVTEMVRNCPSYEKSPTEKTTIFYNQGVDMTDVIQSYPSYQKLPSEKTTIFHNQSVDMTEAVRNCPNYEKPPSEKTTIFPDQSVDMTEAIRNYPNYEKPPSEKTTIFPDQPVDMTEAVRSCPSYEKPPPEKTTIFHNQSVDMTEAIRSCPSYEKSPPEKTTIFSNQAVDMTEVIQSVSTIDKSLISVPEKTTIFNDKSMGTFETIPTGLNIQNPIHNTTSGFTNVEPEKESYEPENKTLELTETVSRVTGVSKLLSRDSCTLAVERHAKQKTLDLEEANRLIASIEVKIPDPEVRSPVTKRMKSLGSRHSIDVTAAVPFVVYRKLARQKCNEINSTNIRLSSVEIDSEKPPNIEVFGRKSMDMTNLNAGSPNVEPLETFPGRSAEIVPQEGQEVTTNFQDKSMEMTETTPCPYPFDPDLQKCKESTENHDWQRPQDTTVCHDDSMEITRAIPGVLKANVPTFHVQSMVEVTRPVSHNQNPDDAENQRFNVLPVPEGKTMVFRDDLMELTSAVQRPSQPIEENRRVVTEDGNSWPIDRELKKDGDFCNDSMEFTRAVPFSFHAQRDDVDKENCPLILENIQSRISRRSENNGSIGVSKTEWLEIMKSVPLLSSEENKENQEVPIELEEPRRNTGSDEITGIVPFADDENVADRELGGGKMVMTEGVSWSSSLNVENPKDMEMETFSPVEKNQQRQSNVAKVLFQKHVSISKDKTGNVKPTVDSATADLDAEIRKLAETFSLSNSIDESGFDQATFLRQQARCMEDYEANSTASQECHSGTLSARQSVPYAMEKRESPNRDLPDSPKLPVGNEEPPLPIANWVTSNSKTADIPVRNSGNFMADNNCSSQIDREQYDRSLEELRCRAYSVSKFRPEVTGFELTAAISINDPHKTIVDEDPPSFLFANSMSVDPIIDCATSVNELPTELGSPISGGEIQPRKSLEKSHVSVYDITETTKDDNVEPEVVEIAEVTLTFENDDNKNAADSKYEKIVEQSESKNRRQTFVIKRPNTDQTIPILSSPETDKNMKNDRLSGVTTAAEFTSESPDGPNEKIRRRESALTAQEKPLPTVDKEGNATELIEIGRSWGNRKFANSTVIGEDFTRQFVHPDVDDTSILIGTPLPDELPSEIVENEDKTVDLKPEVKETNEATMELEIPAPKTPFEALKETIESLAKRPETIWKINRLDEKIVAFNFFSKTIVVAIYLNDNANWNSTIKVIGFLSQLAKDCNDPVLCLAHNVIMKKVNSESLTNSYKTYEDVPRLLEYVTSEVKLGMDFMFELERLRIRTVMDIQENRIKFRVRTRDINAGIILNITMEIKPFEEINSNDITVSYLLGAEKVRENDIKRLIKNVKRDHRFLRFYISDVTDYLDLMAETGFSNRIGAE